MRDRKSFRVILLACIFTLTLAFALMGRDATPANAAPKNTITVNTLADDNTVNGNCTLREAIIAANTNAVVDGCTAGTAGMDVIQFNLSGIITLINVLPGLTEDLTLTGPANGITLDGNGAGYSGFFINTPIILNVSNMTMTNGLSGYGGAIWFNAGGTLNLTNTVFSNNAGTVSGGAIYIGALTSTLNISGATFYSNSVTVNPGASGGAIWSGGDVNIANTTFYSNSAIGNPCCSGGGAMFVYSNTIAITNSTFANNSTNGGGGAIYSAINAPVNMVHTTLANNSAPFGGAIFNNAPLTLTNSIVGFNGNTPCSGAITNGGYNIDAGTNCGFGSNNNSQSNVNPKISGLGNWGGATQTFGLITGSPAINAIPNGTSGCGTTFTRDQRGVARPQNGSCDIGAFEGALNGSYLPLILR